MKTAIYLRKSRAEDVNDSVEDTLRRHKETLLSFASKNDLVVEEIYEEVYTGDSLYSRPQMLRLLESVEDGRYDGVLCMDIDRLGRGGMREQGIILDTFKFSNTKIITPRKIYDLNDELDEEYTEFETFMARRELKTIKRRLRRGLEKTIAEGGYVSNAPYGYERVFENKLPTLRIKEEEAAFVRLIFDLYVNKGIGCQMIAYTINDMGAKPHRAASFGRTSVMRILKNPTYNGKIVWNQKQHIRKGSKGNDKTIVIYNPQEKWVVTDGHHPKIIDDALFQQAQEIIKRRSHPPSNKGIVENPLSGVVFCKNCGAPMQRTRAKGAGNPYYLTCVKKGCMVSSKLEFVERAILKALRSQLELCAAKSKSIEVAKSDQYEAILSALENDLNQLTEQKNKLHDLLEQGVYDIDTYLSRQKALAERTVSVKKSIQETQEQQSRSRRIDYKTTAEKLRDVLQRYEKSNCQDRNILLKSVVESVTYNKEKGAAPNGFTLKADFKKVYF